MIPKEIHHELSIAYSPRCHRSVEPGRVGRPGELALEAVPLIGTEVDLRGVAVVNPLDGSVLVSLKIGQPLGEILQIVQARVPGDIIEVELDRSDKRGWEYEVKVLASNGRVLEVDVNARTGQIRKIEDD